MVSTNSSEVNNIGSQFDTYHIVSLSDGMFVDLCDYRMEVIQRTLVTLCAVQLAKPTLLLEGQLQPKSTLTLNFDLGLLVLVQVEPGVEPRGWDILERDSEHAQKIVTSLTVVY